jgi:hypothetical protein
MKKKPITLDFADVQAVEALFNEAFQHPRRKYVVQPTDTREASEWLKENTWMTNFTWCAGAKSFEQRLQEVGTLRRKQLIHLDELYYRNRCGWAAGDYHCDHPDRENSECCSGEDCEECEGHIDAEGYGKRLCYAFNCPIAASADREDIRKLDPDLWRSDYKDYPDEEPHDWMVLYARPHYAYVQNVEVLGCEDVRRL